MKSNSFLYSTEYWTTDDRIIRCILQRYRQLGIPSLRGCVLKKNILHSNTFTKIGVHRLTIVYTWLQFQSGIVPTLNTVHSLSIVSPLNQSAKSPEDTSLSIGNQPRPKLSSIDIPNLSHLFRNRKVNMKILMPGHLWIHFNYFLLPKMVL